MKQLLLSSVFLIFVTMNLVSQSLTSEWNMLRDSGVHENYEIRQRHRAVVMSKSFEAVNAPKRVFSQTESDVNVRFEVRKTATAFYLMFLNQYQDRFPVWSSGSYIIKKDLVSGNFIQAKVFLYNNENSFIRIYPEQDRSRLDLNLFGQEIYTGVRIPVPFDKLMLLPISKILSLTKNKIPWETMFTDIEYSEWTDVKNLSLEVQSLIPELGDNEDGAIDENGEYVFIETLEPQEEIQGLNCSGFTKWTVDLLYNKLTGNNMPIEPLKKKHYDLRGNSWSDRAEDSRDPFFGLDWTRNIAYLYRKTLYPYLELDFKSCDINSVPYFSYKDNVGYETDEISAALFLEAIKNPGRIYLGSVNRPFGDTFKLRQHVHVVVLFPYFDSSGKFQIDVIERQTKTGIDSLEQRYKGEFMHLVHIELN
ncbi:MAG: hypothetical protein OCD02_23115 [Spirochaetaceae bacterium]